MEAICQINLSFDIPPNVYIDTSLSFGLGSTGKIRKAYYNALAVAVPLKEIDDYSFGTWGLTVVLEGMAMGKPVLSTYSDAYHFNIEKEKIGFYIDYGMYKGGGKPSVTLLSILMKLKRWVSEPSICVNLSTITLYSPKRQLLK